MLEIQRTSETLLVRTKQCELAFRHTGDRWLHELSFPESRRWLGALRSIEGMPEDALPPSPALQDLRLEQLGDRVFEFQGMGQAGAAIYSAAIRLNLVEMSIFFDLCIRGKRGHAGLRAESAYELATGWESQPRLKERGTLQLHSANGQLAIVPIAFEGSPAGECRILDGNGGRRLTAGCLPEKASIVSSTPRSVRWGYRIVMNGRP